MRSATASRAVMTTTGTSARPARRDLSTSRPDLRGSPRSRRTSSWTLAASAASAARPSWTQSTVYPAWRRPAATLSPIMASSSTSSTRMRSSENKAGGTARASRAARDFDRRERAPLARRRGLELHLPDEHRARGGVANDADRLLERVPEVGCFHGVFALGQPREEVRTIGPHHQHALARAVDEVDVDVRERLVGLRGRPHEIERERKARPRLLERVGLRLAQRAADVLDPALGPERGQRCECGVGAPGERPDDRSVPRLRLRDRTLHADSPQETHALAQPRLTGT